MHPIPRYTASLPEVVADPQDAPIFCALDNFKKAKQILFL
jgi:hypothetical protein